MLFSTKNWKSTNVILIRYLKMDPSFTWYYREDKELVTQKDNFLDQIQGLYVIVGFTPQLLQLNTVFSVFHFIIVQNFEELAVRTTLHATPN